MNWKDIKGFTLVEVILVIAMVGIIAGIAMPSVVNIIEKSNSVMLMFLKWRDIMKLIWS